MHAGYDGQLDTYHIPTQIASDSGARVIPEDSQIDVDPNQLDQFEMNRTNSDRDLSTSHVLLGQISPHGGRIISQPSHLEIAPRQGHVSRFTFIDDDDEDDDYLGFYQ